MCQRPTMAEQSASGENGVRWKRDKVRSERCATSIYTRCAMALASQTALTVGLFAGKPIVGPSYVAGKKRSAAGGYTAWELGGSVGICGHTRRRWLYRMGSWREKL